VDNLNFPARPDPPRNEDVMAQGWIKKEIEARAAVMAAEAIRLGGVPMASFGVLATTAKEVQGAYHRGLAEGRQSVQPIVKGLEDRLRKLQDNAAPARFVTVCCSCGSTDAGASLEHDYAEYAVLKCYACGATST
jgi:hypothetical protein